MSESTANETNVDIAATAVATAAVSMETETSKGVETEMGSHTGTGTGTGTGTRTGTGTGMGTGIGTGTGMEMPVTVPKIKPPSRSNIPTPASSVTGIPTKIKPPSHYGSTSSVSKIGRLCCTHTTPKTGPPPRGELKRFSFHLVIYLDIRKSSHTHSKLVSSRVILVLPITALEHPL